MAKGVLDSFGEGSCQAETSISNSPKSTTKTSPLKNGGKGKWWSFPSGGKSLNSRGELVVELFREGNYIYMHLYIVSITCFESGGIFSFTHKFGKIWRVITQRGCQKPTECLALSTSTATRIPVVWYLFDSTPFRKRAGVKSFSEIFLETRWCNPPLFRDSLSRKNHHLQGESSHQPSIRRFDSPATLGRKVKIRSGFSSGDGLPGWSGASKCDLPTVFVWARGKWDLIREKTLNKLRFALVLFLTFKLKICFFP